MEKQDNPVNKDAKPFYKRGWFIALAVFVVIIAIGSNNNNNENNQTYQESLEPRENGQEYMTEEHQMYQESSDIYESGSNQENMFFMFGTVQTINQLNALNEVVGQRGLVTADFDFITDEILIAFFYSYIYGSGLNFFTIDFMDGTGFVFSGSRNMFFHSVLDDGGGGTYPAGRSGVITRDYIVWMEMD